MFWTYTVKNPHLPNQPVICSKLNREQVKSWVGYRIKLVRKNWGPAYKLALMEKRARTPKQKDMFGKDIFLSSTNPFIKDLK